MANSQPNTHNAEQIGDQAANKLTDSPCEWFSAETTSKRVTIHCMLCLGWCLMVSEVRTAGGHQIVAEYGMALDGAGATTKPYGTYASVDEAKEALVKLVTPNAGEMVAIADAAHSLGEMKKLMVAVVETRLKA